MFSQAIAYGGHRRPGGQPGQIHSADQVLTVHVILHIVPL